MKLSLSNQSWYYYEEDLILDMLHHYHIEGLEIAPVRIWPEWKGISANSISEVSKKFKNRGYSVSVIDNPFENTDISLFHSLQQEKIFDHVKLIAHIAQGFNCNLITLSSSSFRFRGELSFKKSVEAAVKIFNKICHILDQFGVNLAIEPIYAGFGCDFLTSIADVNNFINLIQKDNLKISIDSRSLYLNDPKNYLLHLKELDHFSHFHFSHSLESLSNEYAENDKEIVKTLISQSYSRWIGLKMDHEQSSKELRSCLEIYSSLMK